MTAAPKIELRDVASLIPTATNARTHSPEQVQAIKRSLIEFGFTIPVLIDADGIVAGHGRQLAAAEAYAEGHGLTFPGGATIPMGKVPVINVSGWSPEQRRAYVIADNKIALGSGWDDDLLAAELAALSAADYDLSLVGFNDAEIAALLDTGSGATDPEDTPEPPATPVSALGDIWVMGDHRIICGSSTDPETVAAVLAGATPHLMVTDPPYGVEYDANWRNEAARDGATAGRKRGAIGSMGNRGLGAGAIGKVLNDDRADWSEAWALFKGDVAYVWHAGAYAATVADSLTGSGFDIRSQIIWAKQQFAIGRGDYHWQHEPCWYVVRKGKTGHYDGGRKQSTLWEINKPNRSETGHSTQKPIECMQRPVENNSKHGDAIYEPFSGSGTTIIACQITGRRCYAIELSPAYVDVAVLRWQAYATAEAILEATGQTFAEVQVERAAA